VHAPADPDRHRVASRPGGSPQVRERRGQGEGSEQPETERSAARIGAIRKGKPPEGGVAATAAASEAEAERLRCGRPDAGSRDSDTRPTPGSGGGPEGTRGFAVVPRRTRYNDPAAGPGRRGKSPVLPAGRRETAGNPIGRDAKRGLSAPVAPMPGNVPPSWRLAWRGNRKAPRTGGNARLRGCPGGCRFDGGPRDRRRREATERHGGLVAGPPPVGSAAGAWTGAPAERQAMTAPMRATALPAGLPARRNGPHGQRPDTADGGRSTGGPGGEMRGFGPGLPRPGSGRLPATARRRDGWAPETGSGIRVRVRVGMASRPVRRAGPSL